MDVCCSTNPKSVLGLGVSRSPFFSPHRCCRLCEAAPQPTVRPTRAGRDGQGRAGADRRALQENRRASWRRARGDRPAIEIPGCICSAHPAVWQREWGQFRQGPFFVKICDPLPPAFLFYI